MSAERFEPARVFTSRWWGIVSTVYLLCGTFLVFVSWGIWFFEGDTVALKIMRTAAFIAPLILGFAIASTIEAHRSPEPARGYDHALRGVRIAVGFLIPIVLFVAGQVLGSVSK